MHVWLVHIANFPIQTIELIQTYLEYLHNMYLVVLALLVALPLREDTSEACQL